MIKYKMNLNNDVSVIEGFDWDKGNLGHIKKHNVSKEECEEAFFNIQPEITRDITHSQIEERYRIFGQTDEGRLLFMIITVRGNMIRVISARDQNKKERQEFTSSGGD